MLTINTLSEETVLTGWPIAWGIGQLECWGQDPLTWAPCVSCVSWAKVSLTWPCWGRGVWVSGATEVGAWGAGTGAGGAGTSTVGAEAGLEADWPRWVTWPWSGGGARGQIIQVDWQVDKDTDKQGDSKSATVYITGFLQVSVSQM